MRKTIKKIFCIALSVLLLVSLLTSLASADENYSYEKMLTDLANLEAYAKKYSANNADSLTLIYIRTGYASYTGTKWTLMAGSSVEAFEKYVSEQDAKNNTHASDLKKLRSVTLPNGETLEAIHMIATMNMILKGNGDLGGWAGDTCDLLYYKMQYASANLTQEQLVSLAAGYLGTSDSGFSYEDLRADLDALNIYNAKTSTYAETIRNYYASVTPYTRVNRFLNNRFSAQASKDALRSTVYGAYKSAAWVSTLESSRSLSKVSDTLRKACCYAFADYLYAINSSYTISYSWNGEIPTDAILPADKTLYSSCDTAKNSVDITYNSDSVLYGEKEGQNGKYTFSGWSFAGESNHVLSYSGTWTFTPLDAPELFLVGGGIHDGSADITVFLKSSGEAAAGSFTVSYDSALSPSCTMITGGSTKTAAGKAEISWQTDTPVDGFLEIAKLHFDSAKEAVLTLTSASSYYVNGKSIPETITHNGSLGESSPLCIAAAEAVINLDSVSITLTATDPNYGTTCSLSSFSPVVALYDKGKLLDLSVLSDCSFKNGIFRETVTINGCTDYTDYRVFILNSSSFSPLISSRSYSK